MSVFADTRSIVGIDNAGHQGMAHDIRARQVRDGNAGHAPEHALSINQATELGLGKVNLADVAGDDCLGDVYKRQVS